MAQPRKRNRSGQSRTTATRPHVTAISFYRNLQILSLTADQLLVLGMPRTQWQQIQNIVNTGMLGTSLPTVAAGAQRRPGQQQIAA